VPAQIVLALAVILTLAARLELTDMVILFDVATVEVTHEAVDVITQVTTALFVKVELINVELLVPTFTPFTFH
jgi:hypothetical protein